MPGRGERGRDLKQKQRNWRFIEGSELEGRNRERPGQGRSHPVNILTLAHHWGQEHGQEF